MDVRLMVFADSICVFAAAGQNIFFETARLRTGIGVIAVPKASANTKGRHETAKYRYRRIHHWDLSKRTVCPRNITAIWMELHQRTPIERNL
jgi:hypothetical protein